MSHSNQDPNSEALKSWEQLMACCFPWGFVWMKEGCGSSCCLNYFLGFLCCANICHACTYVGKQGKPGSPYQTILGYGAQSVIRVQPR